MEQANFPADFNYEGLSIEQLKSGLERAKARVERLESEGAKAVLISGAKFIVEAYQDEIRNRK
jgi:hypothetical protein